MTDLTNREFGRLKVIRYSHNKGFDQYWICRCRCGIEKPVCHRNLLYAGVESCGCKQREKAAITGRNKRTNVAPNSKLNNYLTTVKEVEQDKSGHRRWLCLCVCGITKEFSLQDILRCPNLSCGCESRKLGFKNRKTHKKYYTPEYRIYRGMLQRCYDKNLPDYHRYGGRGIQVRDRWRNSFQNFYDDLVSSIGLRPSSEHSIDRVNNNGNYEPGNIKWSTKQEQANNRRSNRLITAFGKTQTSVQWQRETGISYQQINRRIFKWNWSIENALTLLPDNHRRYSQRKKDAKEQTQEIQSD